MFSLVGGLVSGSSGGTVKFILLFRTPKIQFAKHMKRKKKEDQSVDTDPS